MDDKQALLQSIRNYPDEDMPRLMFADYLDENITSDLDKSTAEFIRMSCRLQNKKRQYTDEGKWLGENWSRLVPSLCSTGFKIHKRVGRFITLKRKFKDRASHNIWVVLEFWKGFVKNANIYRIADIKHVFPHLVKDQILVECGVDNLPQWATFYAPGSGEGEVAFNVSLHRCPEIFDFVQGHDIDNYENPYGRVFQLNLPGRPVTLKTFTGSKCKERAEKSVSDAIRAWCLSLSSP
jgi:uncharacterized protein (TIGR02996 family)